MSAQTIRHHHNVIRAALSYAVKMQLVIRNVTSLVVPPQVPIPEYTTRTPSQVSTLLEAARGSMWYEAIYLTLFTGLRRSTLLGLRWRYCDLDRSRLHISQAYNRINKQDYIREPKTKRSRQSIVLDEDSLEMLKRYKETKMSGCEALGLPFNDDQLVFSYSSGKPYTPGGLSHAVPRIAVSAGLPRIKLHELRHTHATILLSEGVHLKAVQDSLGHSTIATTADIYSHMVDGLQVDAAAKFGEAIRRDNV